MIKKLFLLIEIKYWSIIIGLTFELNFFLESIVPVSESKINDGILFSFNFFDPNLIASKAFMSLNFQVLNFALLIEVLGSFLHVYHHSKIRLIYVKLN